MKTKKILLTGATGFLGSYLLRSFVKNGHQVAILKRSFSDISRIEDLMGNVKSFDIDVTPIEKSFEECGQFDCVVHTATNYGRKGESAIEVFGVNLSFSLNLLDTATIFNTATFINTSTVLPSSMNCYALSKRQFESWGRLFASQDKIQFVNIKLEHMYGPGDDSTKFTTWIVDRCLNNVEKIELTLGEQKRDFIYIDEVVNAYNLLLKKSADLKDRFQEYDLGSGRAVTIREFVETVKKITNSSTKLDFGAKEYRAKEIMFSQADVSKLIELGMEFKYDLRTGVKNMINIEEEV